MTAQPFKDRQPQEARRDYFAQMTCGAGDNWVARAIDQVGSWLREKKWDVDLMADGAHRRHRDTLTIEHVNDRAGHDYRMSLDETNDGGQWSTELVLHDARGSADWLTLSVRSLSGAFVKVPRLARYLMSVLPLRDGPVEYLDGRHEWGAAEVETLVDLLADQSRQGLVFVAGTDASGAVPVDAFSQQVERWARETAGLAQVVVLDPEGTAAFSSRVGSAFHAPSWTIRTYRPHVRFGDSIDSKRHRILGTERLAHYGEYAIVRLLGEIARGQTATRPTQPDVVRVRRRLERHANRLLLDALEVVPPALTARSDRADRDSTPAVSTTIAPSVDPLTVQESDQRELILLRSLFGIERVTEEALLPFVRAPQLLEAHAQIARALEQRVTDLQSANEQLEDRHAELLSVLDDAQIENELLQMDLDAKTARESYLVAQLHEHRDYQAEYLETPTEFIADRPASFAELLTRIGSMDTVVFTGEPAEVEQLNILDTNDSALRVAWDAVLTMHDYVRARRDGVCVHGLRHYTEAPPSGYQTIAPGKFGDTETGVTMRSFGHERIFPVPTEISPNGRIEMKAHFKLARIGMASPRMYIHDGHPSVPKVFIGYIGVHLTNTQTR